MSSRMNKYYEEPENLVTRTTRNQNLYKDINKSELENYSIQSNATVLGDNKNEIDVEKIKKILDTKYNETPRRKTIHIEEEPEEIIEHEDTKEYDIKAILEKAKEEKIVSYEEDRLKKLRDTQFDILKNLNTTETVVKDQESDNLEKLINTISINELQNKNDEPDLFDDLLGDNTQIQDVKESEDISQENQIIVEDDSEDELEESMYTKSNAIDNRDFEDVEEGMNIVVKIIVGIIILAFIAGVIIILKPILFN